MNRPDFRQVLECGRAPPLLLWPRADSQRSPSGQPPATHRPRGKAPRRRRTPQPGGRPRFGFRAVNSADSDSRGTASDWRAGPMEKWRNTAALQDAGAVSVAARNSKPSLLKEQLALHQRVNEAPHAVMAGTGALQNVLNLFAVGEADRGAGGIDRQLPDEIAGDLLLVGEQQLFELAHVAELSAVRQ